MFVRDVSKEGGIPAASWFLPTALIRVYRETENTSKAEPFDEDTGVGVFKAMDNGASRQLWFLN